MNGSFRWIAAAAAVLLIAVVGFAVLGRTSDSGVGGAPATPSPSPSPSTAVAPNPTASPSWDKFDVGPCGETGCGGPLTAGTYTSTGLKPAVTYTLTSPWVNLRDWPEFFQFYPDTLDNRALAAAGNYAPYILILPDPVMVSPSAACQETITTPVSDEIEVDAAGFAEYLASRDGLTLTGPMPVIISGQTGLSIDVGIEPGWTGCLPGTPFGRTTAQTDRLRYVVLDTVNGDSLMISLWAPTDFDQFLTDAMPIVESFEFDLTQEPSPSP